MSWVAAYALRSTLPGDFEGLNDGEDHGGSQCTCTCQQSLVRCKAEKPDQPIDSYNRSDSFVGGRSVSLRSSNDNVDCKPTSVTLRSSNDNVDCKPTGKQLQLCTNVNSSSNVQQNITSVFRKRKLRSRERTDKTVKGPYCKSAKRAKMLLLGSHPSRLMTQETFLRNSGLVTNSCAMRLKQELENHGEVDLDCQIVAVEGPMFVRPLLMSPNSRSLMSHIRREVPEVTEAKKQLAFNLDEKGSSDSEDSEIDVGTEQDAVPRRMTPMSLLAIDFSSPLGQRVKRHVKGDLVVQPISDVEKYCIATPEEIDGMAFRLRKRTSFHVKHKISKKGTITGHCHIFKFTNAERRQFLITLRTGLNYNSRRLLDRMKDLHVQLKNITIDDIRLLTLKKKTLINQEITIDEDISIVQVDVPEQLFDRIQKMPVAGNTVDFEQNAPTVSTGQGTASGIKASLPKHMRPCPKSRRKAIPHGNYVDDEPLILLSSDEEGERAAADSRRNGTAQMGEQVSSAETNSFSVSNREVQALFVSSVAKDFQRNAFDGTPPPRIGLSNHVYSVPVCGASIPVSESQPLCLSNTSSSLGIIPLSHTDTVMSCAPAYTTAVPQGLASHIPYSTAPSHVPAHQGHSMHLPRSSVINSSTVSYRHQESPPASSSVNSLGIDSHVNSINMTAVKDSPVCHDIPAAQSKSTTTTQSSCGYQSASMVQGTPGRTGFCSTAAVPEPAELPSVSTGLASSSVQTPQTLQSPVSLQSPFTLPTIPLSTASNVQSIPRLNMSVTNNENTPLYQVPSSMQGAPVLQTASPNQIAPVLLVSPTAIENTPMVLTAGVPSGPVLQYAPVINSPPNVPGTFVLINPGGQNTCVPLHSSVNPVVLKTHGGQSTLLLQDTENVQAVSSVSECSVSDTQHASLQNIGVSVAPESVSVQSAHLQSSSDHQTTVGMRNSLNSQSPVVSFPSGSLQGTSRDLTVSNAPNTPYLQTTLVQNTTSMQTAESVQVSSKTLTAANMQTVELLQDCSRTPTPANMQTVEHLQDHSRTLTTANVQSVPHSVHAAPLAQNVQARPTTASNSQVLPTENVTHSEHSRTSLDNQITALPQSRASVSGTLPPQHGSGMQSVTYTRTTSGAALVTGHASNNPKMPQSTTSQGLPLYTAHSSTQLQNVSSTQTYHTVQSTGLQSLSALNTRGVHSFPTSQNVSLTQNTAGAPARLAQSAGLFQETMSIPNSFEDGDSPAELRKKLSVFNLTPKKQSVAPAISQNQADSADNGDTGSADQTADSGPQLRIGAVYGAADLSNQHLAASLGLDNSTTSQSNGQQNFSHSDPQSLQYPRTRHLGAQPNTNLSQPCSQPNSVIQPSLLQPRHLQPNRAVPRVPNHHQQVAEWRRVSPGSSVTQRNFRQPLPVQGSQPRRGPPFQQGYNRGGQHQNYQQGRGQACSSLRASGRALRNLGEMALLPPARASSQGKRMTHTDDDCVEVICLDD